MATHGMCGHSKWHMFYAPQSLVCHNSRHLFSGASRYYKYLQIPYMNSIAYRIIFLIVFLSLQLILSILQTFQTLLRPPRNWTASAPNFSRRISCRSSSKLFSKDALNKALPFLSAARDIGTYHIDLLNSLVNNKDGGLLLQKSPKHVLMNSMKHITLFLKNRTFAPTNLSLITPTLISSGKASPAAATAGKLEK